METGVYLLQGDNTLTRMVAEKLGIEADLQKRLAEHPDLLGGDQINSVEPRRWLLIDRELGVPGQIDGSNRWALDHLFLDQDAIPTFVEVKRATDTRIRREVVAQMLDYAANATEYLPGDRMQEIFTRHCLEAGLDVSTEVTELLEPDRDESTFWDLAKNNLREGKVRLLFVADVIPPELRRIVEFLQRQMNPAEVLAVEIRQFASDGTSPMRVIVPRVIGQTEQSRATKAGARGTTKSTPISREQFADAFRADRRNVALTILQVAEEAGFVATDYRSRGKVSVRITLPGLAGAPLTLLEDYLRVSLSGALGALSNPRLNNEIRQAILALAPCHKQATDPTIGSVYIPLDTINPADGEPLRAIFAIVKRGLEQGQQVSGRDGTKTTEDRS